MMSWRKKIENLFVLALFAASFFVSASDVHAFPCIGAPPDDTTNYPEPRVFLESQGWWKERNSDGSLSNNADAEHLHIGMCFPLQQPVSGITQFRVRVMSHNLPIDSMIRSTRLHDANGTVLASISWNRSIFSKDQEYWTDVQVDSTQVPSGMREFRVLTRIRRPGGSEIHASSGWCWQIENGGTINNQSSCDRRLTEARGWYNCFAYKVARAQGWDYPYEGIPADANYSLPVAMRDGSGGNSLVSGHEVRLDPNFHKGIPGTVIASGIGPTSGKTITINGPLLTPGVHRLMIRTIVDGKCTDSNGNVLQDGELSGIMVIPILVR